MWLARMFVCLATNLQSKFYAGFPKWYRGVKARLCFHCGSCQVVNHMTGFVRDIRVSGSRDPEVLSMPETSCAAHSSTTATAHSSGTADRYW